MEFIEIYSIEYYFCLSNETHQGTNTVELEVCCVNSIKRSAPDYNLFSRTSDRKNQRLV